ncbi:MAG: energy-coupling factor transporter transmembrane component T [Synergistes jonesii]|uniref:energy-coupling factor transporter transmembrane component T family protein n=1 Tax=Synergistes jonesii TaxID=2754 RepID=UPI002A751083|nr:energy-coupling factor transporter transmembrane component T [Synergistes jonesii]MDY2984032.1 energy-coupling factor transporter transmembrane component T [Synergistes jonesii]
MDGLFECADSDGLIYRINPSVKLIIAFAVGMSAFAVKSVAGALFIAVLTILAVAFSGLGRKALSMALLLAKISTLLFVIQLLCAGGGNVIFRAGPLRITDEGVFFSLLMVAKLIAASLPLMLALSATKRGDLANSLVQNCRLPYKYAFALTATLKFIPVLAGEMVQIIEAQRARGVDFDVRNPLKKAALVAPLCLPLMLSCVRRTENSAIAAQLRGFELRRRDSGYKKYPIGIKDASAAALSAVVIVFAFML